MTNFVGEDGEVVEPVEEEVPYTFVEITVQLGNREAVTFRREFGFDVDPLEKLTHLVDAIKGYLESD